MAQLIISHVAQREYRRLYERDHGTYAPTSFAARAVDLAIASTRRDARFFFFRSRTDRLAIPAFLAEAGRKGS